MPTNYLTKEGYQKLQDDLINLRENRRKEIAERLHNAIDEGGELVENAEYEAAKNEQAFVEGRIKELELLLASARIVEEDEPSDKVRIGSKITIQEDGGELETGVGGIENRRYSRYACPGRRRYPVVNLGRAGES